MKYEVGLKYRAGVNPEDPVNPVKKNNAQLDNLLAKKRIYSLFFTNQILITNHSTPCDRAPVPQNRKYFPDFSIFPLIFY